MTAEHYTLLAFVIGLVVATICYLAYLQNRSWKELSVQIEKLAKDTDEITNRIPRPLHVRYRYHDPISNTKMNGEATFYQFNYGDWRRPSVQQAVRASLQQELPTGANVIGIAVTDSEG